MILRSAALGLMLLSLGTVFAAEQLVPLQNQNQRNDVLGFRWDLQLDGSVGDGTNDCFDGAFNLWIDAGNQGQRQFQHDNRPMATVDQREWVLSNSFNQLVVTRRIRLDTKLGIMRYVEVIENRGTQTVPVELNLNIDLGHSVRQAQTTAGRPCVGEMQIVEDERGLMLTQQGNRPSLGLYMGRTSDDIVCSTMADAGNGDVSYRFRFDVAGRDSVAIVHAVGQRMAGRMPGDDFFAACDSPAFLADLPDGVRSLIANVTRGGTSFAGVSIDDLQLEPAASDLVALGGESILRGRLDWTSASLTGEHGSMAIQPGQVLAMTGPAWRSDRDLVFMRDGQVLSGRLAITEPVLHLDAGFSLPLGDRPLDRIRMAQRQGETGPTPAWFAATYSGDVYRVQTPVDSPLALATPWGPLELSMHEIRSLSPLADDPIGAMELTTDSGTRLPVLLAAAELQLAHQRFGQLTFDAGLFAGLRSPASFQDPPEPDHSRSVVKLAEHVLVGELRSEAVTVVVSGRPLVLPWRQIGSIERQGDDMLLTCWNGSRLLGTVSGQSLTVGIGAGALTIPLADVESVTLPKPGLSPAQKARILDLVQRLGSESWSDREAATKELIDIGETAHAMLEGLREEQKDEEVRHRIDLVLDTDSSDEALP